MPVVPPLLITSRPGFARHVIDLVPEVTVSIAAPEAVSLDQWANAPAVLLDAVALRALRARALPALPHTWVITDTAPTPGVFADAVALRVERVVELPAGETWLAEEVRAIRRRGSVIAVVGIGIGIGTSTAQTATTVALALAFASLVREERVAVVGLHRGQTLVEQLNAQGTDTSTPDPDRAGQLTVLTRGDQPTPPGHTPRLITDLAGAHDLVILDTPPPSNPDSGEALASADIVLAVATPDQRHHPDLDVLTAPGSATADRVRVAVLTRDPALAIGWGHPLIPPEVDPSRWITDPAFGRHCAAVAEPARA